GLAAGGARAGGRGITAALNLPLDEVRRRIRRIRELTDRPFGVNLWLHSELRPPADVARLPEATIRAVQGALNRFRERLEIPATLARPAQVPDLIDQAIGVILDERVPVFSAGIRLPDAGMIRRCHDHGVKVMAMVATVEDARAAAGDGADGVIAQGAEAGGHRSVGVKPVAPDTVSVGTMAFVPQVVDAVGVPVVAAGGLADGRGLVAALALGAGGVLRGPPLLA